MDSTEQAAKFQLPFTRKDVYIAGGILVFALLLYFRTLARDVLFGDSGEFQVQAVTGGLSHATGYPVYLIIAKIFSLLPLGSLAARVSAVSAVFGSIAVAKVYLLGRSLQVRRLFSMLGALALLISPLFWWQSTVAEVYTISADFFAGFLLCVLIWKHNRDSRWLAAGGLLGALCLGLHHTVVLSLPFVLLYFVLCKAKKPDWTSVAGGIVAGIALSFAAYMIEGSIDSPATSTNHLHPYASQFGMESADDLDVPLTRVKFIFFAEEAKGDVQPTRIPENAPAIAREIVQDFGWVIPCLAVAGAIVMFARPGRRKEGMLLVGSYLTIFLFALCLHAFDIEVEFIQPHMLMCLVAAVGLQGLQEAIWKARGPEPTPSRIAGAVGVVLVVGGAATILIAAVPAFIAGKPTFLTSVRREIPYPVDFPSEPHDLGRAIVSHVPDGSMLLLTWTYTYACFYVAEFELSKPNIDIVGPFPALPPSKADEQFSLNFYIESAKKRPLFEDQPDPHMDADFKQVPYLSDPKNGRVYLYRLIPRQALGP